MTDYSGNTLSQTCHHLLTIESIIILHNHRRLSPMRTDKDAGLELRDVKFHCLNLQWRITNLIFADNTHLINEVDLGIEAIVGSNTGVWVLLMAKHLVEIGTHSLQEVSHSTLTDMTMQG